MTVQNFKNIIIVISTKNNLKQVQKHNRKKLITISFK